MCWIKRKTEHKCGGLAESNMLTSVLLKSQILNEVNVATVCHALELTDFILVFVDVYVKIWNNLTCLI